MTDMPFGIVPGDVDALFGRAVLARDVGRAAAQAASDLCEVLWQRIAGEDQSTPKNSTPPWAPTLIP